MRQAEFETKLTLIRSWLKKKGLGGVALSTQQLFAWATAGGDNHVVLGNEQGVATFLVTPDSMAVLTNNIEVERIGSEEFKGIDTAKFEFWACPWYEDAVITAAILRRMGRQPWASDTGLAGSVLTGEDFTELTYSLAEQEISRYRTLGKDCAVAMEEALAPVRPGITEHEIAGLICEKLWDHGVRPHVILVASDERVLKFRHPIPTGKKVKKHLMAVLCGKRGGLIVSLTRMQHFARKLPDELRQKHSAACSIDIVINSATRPGLAMKEVFAAGVAEYARQGFPDEWKLHHQGGPTGYQGRSFRGTPTEERLVRDHQAYAWNPSITGTKSEDTMVVHGGGFEFLSSPTKSWPSLAFKANGKTFKRADIKLV